MAHRKLRRKVKELVGGRKTYLKSKAELEAGAISRSLRRAKNQAAKATPPKKETSAQKDRRTYISPSTNPSTLSYGEWLNKTGKGATAATSMQYYKMKKESNDRTQK